jgi:3D (Asp-Asp-Asp) domain-containing protein/sulfur carrier protein ThiS
MSCNKGGVAALEWYTFKRPLPREATAVRRRTYRRYFWLVPLLLAGLLVGGYGWAFKEVTVVVDGQERVVRTSAGTVGELLGKLGLRAARVEPPEERPLARGTVVNVVTGRHVRLVVQGEEREIFTRGQTVAEVLAEQGMTLAGGLRVEPAPETPVTENMIVRVVRVEHASVVEEVDIPYGIRREPSDSLLKGETRVLRKGRPGLERRVWEVEYHDGQEAGRLLKETQLLAPPVDEVVAVGTVQTISRGGHVLRFSRVLTMLATAYTYTGRNTASGVPPGPGVAAVDPAVIPMGTRLYVDGYGFAVALDRGSSIKGNRIDLFFPEEADAWRWGARWVKVYVLD